jgi:hypothetical protein
MKLILVLTIGLFLFQKSVAQREYDVKVALVAKDIYEAIAQKQNVKICLLYIKKADGSVTNLSDQICRDISTDLAGISAKKTTFTVVPADKINLFLKQKKIQAEGDVISMLKKKNEVDILCTGLISEMGTEYRVMITLTDIKEDKSLGGAKMYLTKDKDLESLNGIINTNTFLAEEKVKPKRENKFWKAMGEMATTTITTTANEYLQKTLSKSGNSGNTYDSTTNSSASNNSPNSSLPGNTTATNNECIANETGNICFSNTTTNDLDVTLYRPSSDGNGAMERTGLEIILKAGEKDCMYNVTKGNYTYIAQTAGVSRGYNGPSYIKRSTVFITACKEWNISLR